MKIDGFRLASLVAALVVGCVASLSATAQQATPALDDIGKNKLIKVGWATWYPYVYRDPTTKGLTGASVKIVEDIAKHLDVKLEWVEEQGATAIAGLQAGKFHIYGTPMAITLPRARAVTYTEPFLQTRAGILARKEDAAQYGSWKDVVAKPGLKACLALGSNIDLWATRVFKSAELIRVKEAPMCITEVLARKSDVMLTGMDSFPKITSEHPGIVAVKGDAWMSGKVGFLVRFGDHTMRDWLNYYFDEMKLTGDLDRLLTSHGLDASFIYRGN